MRYLLLALAVVAAPAMAQDERCDKTGGGGSQNGCPPSVKVAAKDTEVFIYDHADGPGRALCMAAVASEFRHPASVKIDMIGKTGAQRIEVHEHKVIALVYSMQINLKNSDGRNEGEKAYYCFVSTDEKTVYRTGARPNPSD